MLRTIIENTCQKKSQKNWKDIEEAVNVEE